jgi:hypothetical protein
MLNCLVSALVAAGDKHMAYKAHVWLTRRRIDLGIIDADPKPERHRHVSFEYGGRRERGLVDQIDPYDWEKRPGTTPRIHVTLSEGVGGRA